MPYVPPAKVDEQAKKHKVSEPKRASYDDEEFEGASIGSIESEKVQEKQQPDCTED